MYCGRISCGLSHYQAHLLPPQLWSATGPALQRTTVGKHSAHSMRAMVPSATAPVPSPSTLRHPKSVHTIPHHTYTRCNPLQISLCLQLASNNVADVPVSIIASNRPLYLFRYTILLYPELQAPLHSPSPPLCTHNNTPQSQNVTWSPLGSW